MQVHVRLLRIKVERQARGAGSTGNSNQAAVLVEGESRTSSHGWLRGSSQATQKTRRRSRDGQLLQTSWSCELRGVSGIGNWTRGQCRIQAPTLVGPELKNAPRLRTCQAAPFFHGLRSKESLERGPRNPLTQLSSRLLQQNILQPDSAQTLLVGRLFSVSSSSSSKLLLTPLSAVSRLPAQKVSSSALGDDALSFLLCSQNHPIST